MIREQRTAEETIAAQIPAARNRERQARLDGERAASAYYDAPTGRVIMELTNGYIFGFPTDAIPALAAASAEELAAVELGPGGGGLHWESLEVDLSVPGLLLSALGRSAKLSELARLAGQVSSPAKAEAARANGARGGRPRKVSEGG